MKKFIFTFILILLCVLPLSVFGAEQFSYSFETQADADMWFGGIFDDSNPSESGFSLYVNNPFGEVRNDRATHVIDYSPSINLEGGKVYTLSGYVMNPMSDHSPSLRAYADRGAGSNTVIATISGIGDEWGYFSATFFAGESGEYNLSLHFSGCSVDFGLFVDELKLEEISCTLSSLNLSGPDEIIIPATGSIKNYYRPFLLTAENQAVDILSSSNLHFSVPDSKGISFNSRDFSLTVTHEASVNSNVSIGCALRNYKELTPAFMPIALTDNIIDNSDFSKDDLLWESNADINLLNENGNRYIKVPMSDYGGLGYYTTITYSNSQLLHKDALYVIRARVKSDIPEKTTPIHAVNTAEIQGATLYFTVTDISDDKWTEVFAAFRPEEDGIYDIALNLCSQVDCTIFIDDIKLSCEALSPEYITMHAPGNITLPNIQTSYPFSALLRNQLGDIIPSDDVMIEISENDGSFYFDNVNNSITVFPDTTPGTYTLTATYLPDPDISATLDFTISFDYIGDGTFEKTIPNEWWMVASPYESSLYMRNDGTSRRALINCNGNYFMLLNNSYVHLLKNTPYVFNSAFSTATDCTGTLFIETLDNQMLPLAQFFIAGGTTLDEKRLPELFLAEEDAVGRLFFYFESNNGEPFTLYADNLSLKIASIVAVNPHIVGSPVVNGAVEAGFTLFNNIAENSDSSACFVNWYVSSTQNGVYEEVSTAERNIYFDTTFINKYVYFEVTPVCPITGFSGNTVRSLPFLVTYDSQENSSAHTPFIPIIENVTVEDIHFSDIDSHWGKKYIEKLAKSGVVNGKSKNKFKPDDSVTRAEFSKMLSVAFSVKNSTDLPLFSDVKNTDWYYDYINSLYLAGIVKGTSSTSFSPQKTITREESVAMIMRLYNLASEKPVIPGSNISFNDESQISSWAVEDAEKAVRLNIIQGTSSGNFAPKRNLSRVEAAALICRLAEILY